MEQSRFYRKLRNVYKDRYIGYRFRYPGKRAGKDIFPFYRSNAVQEQEGVGIGLYLARQIISGESGYIKVASVPGKGSTFSIFLPK